MPKKSLQGWYYSDDITCSQKKVIQKFGVGDYYPECALRDFKKLWYYNEIFERNQGQVPKKIQQLVFFSAYWNNNIIIIVDGDNFYMLRFLIYEMPSSNMEEIFEIFPVCGSYNLSEIKDKISLLEQRLKGNHPILYKELDLKPELNILYDNDYSLPRDFPSVWIDWVVKRIEIDLFSVLNAWGNPDDYFKPLDIVKLFVGDSETNYFSKNEKMRHTCVYLGNKKVAHVLGGNQVKIDVWRNFLTVILPSAAKPHKMIRYHPVVAFKRPEKVVEHVARCSQTPAGYCDVKGSFSISNNNCEHFANRCVLGMNFSELNDKREDKTSRKIDIQSSLNETNSRLDYLGSYPSNKISEINNCKAYHPQGIPMEGRIEVSPKGSYWYNG